MNKDIIYKRNFGIINPDPSKPNEYSSENCYPDRIISGRDARIKDIDGKEYLDFCLANGSLVLGHQDKDFLEAVQYHTNLAAQIGQRQELISNYSRMIHEAFPSMERTLFMESGDMATAQAMEIARLHADRKVIVRAVPEQSCPNEGEIENMVSVPFNDLDCMTGEMIKNEVAAIILQPVPCFPGPMVPEEDYLHQLREIADANDILLIFDERTTGFRLAMGGAQEHYHVRPDITILGKVAGGGYPIGICGASEDLMDARISKMTEADISNIDPFPIAAGMETVRRLRMADHVHLNQMGERMGRGLEAVLNEFHVRYKASTVGSMFQVFLDPMGVDVGGRRATERNLYRKVWDIAFENGVLFSPSQNGTNFISTAHNEDDIDEAVNAILVSLGEAVL